MYTKLRFSMMLLCVALVCLESYGRGFGGGRGGAIRGGGGFSGGAVRAGGGFSGGGVRAPGGGFSAPQPSYNRPTYNRPSYSRPTQSYSRPSTSTRPGVVQRSGTTSSPVRSGNTGSRTYTGKNGGTVTIGGGAGRIDGSRGSAGGAALGTRITTPGGRTITRGRTIGGATNGNVTIGSAARGSRVTGPGGTVTRGERLTAGRNLATDNGFAKYSRGAVVRSSGGNVAVAHRTHAVSSQHGRYHGAAVRTNFASHHYHHHHNCFGHGWYVAHPHAWRVTGWTAAAYWTTATLNNMYGWWGWGTPAMAYITPVYGAETAPAYYDYGNTIVYEGDQVYYDDKPVATAEEYYEDAVEIAEEGIEAEVSVDEEWRSFGVFGMVQGDSTEANKILQLAVNQKGVVRGNYFDTLTQTTLPVQGSVDKQSKRVAWTVGDNKEVVYETGLVNLSREEAQMLVHYGKDKTLQWTIVRLEAPEEG